MLWPAVCTVFAAAANFPVFAKFGFSLTVVGVSDPRSLSKALFCDGSGPRDRCNGLGERERERGRSRGIDRWENV